MLPLYEAKMLHLYDTRWATYHPDGSAGPMTQEDKGQRCPPMPRYWVHEGDVDSKLGRHAGTRSLVGWRRICRATDARTLICTRVPTAGFGDSWFMAVPSKRPGLLQAAWSSFIVDYVARQKLGGTNMNFFTVMQLPMLCLEDFETGFPGLDRGTVGWIENRVDRLNGWLSDDIERARVRAELDALMFHLYGLTRDEVSHVFDTFPIVKRKDEAAFGSFRTKDLILAAYDALTDAKESGVPYRAPWDREVVSS